MHIKRATEKDIPILSELADEIWHQHFHGIISDGQIEYMLNNFQSQSAMKAQMQNDGYEYYMFIIDEKPQGYFAIAPQISESERVMFISKVYIRQAQRGKGFAREAFKFIENEGKKRGLDKTRLTVNKHNDNSVAIYKKLGMYIAAEQTADIGNGYVMDDYIFEKKLV